MMWLHKKEIRASTAIFVRAPQRVHAALQSPFSMDLRFWKFSQFKISIFGCRRYDFCT